jgi:predicted nucleic acid-binding protein
MIVVDASVVCEVVLQSSEASAAEAWISKPGQMLHAPHLMDLEVAHVMRRLLYAGQIDEPTANLAMANLADLRIQRYAHYPLMDRIWALRANLSAYDAAYVALAEALDAPLITRDKRLASAPGHNARITLV